MLEFLAPDCAEKRLAYAVDTVVPRLAEVFQYASEPHRADYEVAGFFTPKGVEVFPDSVLRKREVDTDVIFGSNQEIREAGREGKVSFHFHPRDEEVSGLPSSDDIVFCHIGLFEVILELGGSTIEYTAQNQKNTLVFPPGVNIMVPRKILPVEKIVETWMAMPKRACGEPVDRGTFIKTFPRLGTTFVPRI